MLQDGDGKRLSAFFFFFFFFFLCSKVRMPRFNEFSSFKIYVYRGLGLGIGFSLRESASACARTRYLSL